MQVQNSYPLFIRKAVRIYSVSFSNYIPDYLKVSEIQNLFKTDGFIKSPVTEQTLNK